MMREEKNVRKPYTGPGLANKENQGSQLKTVVPNMKAYTDSGMVSNYRPAAHSKPTGPLYAIQNIWNKMNGYVSPSLTTQQGSATSSPSVTQFLLYSLRYERWQIIGDCNNIYADDGRARVSTNMYVDEAVRKGIVISVSDTGERSATMRNQRAQQIINDVAKIFTPSMLSASGKGAVVEGDLFWHISTFNGQVINVERRPASAMERNTDDADEFIDVNKAFSQIDTTTTAEVATYPLWQIWHGKWDYMDGDRYGKSALFSSRRCYRLQEMIEEAQVRRRISRAPQRKHWKIGDEKHPGTKDQVDAFKNEIGMQQGNGSQYDPISVGIDYFSTNAVDCVVIEGDATVHEIEDVKYFENLYAAGLLTPGPLYNLASGDINRDVLEDMRAQWLNSTRKLNDFLTEGIRYACDIALMLAGIDPASISYSVHWSDSSTETPSEVINRVLLLLNNGTGIGTQNFVRLPLISFRRALASVAEYTGVVDVDEELRAIDADLKNNIGALSVPQPINPNSSSVPIGAPKSPTAPKPPQKDSEMMGSEPLGGVLHSGNSNNHVAPIKPVQSKIDPVTSSQALGRSQRGIGGASVGAGQSAALQNETYGVPRDQPDY